MIYWFEIGDRENKMVDNENVLKCKGKFRKYV